MTDLGPTHCPPATSETGFDSETREVGLKGLKGGGKSLRRELGKGMKSEIDSSCCISNKVVFLLL